MTSWRELCRSCRQINTGAKSKVCLLGAEVETAVKHEKPEVTLETLKKNKGFQKCPRRDKIFQEEPNLNLPNDFDVPLVF